MRIVVSGGNGYIGARLSRDLANNGNQLIPVCHKVNRLNKEWNDLMFDIIEGDITDDNVIDRIFNLKPDVIIHLVSLNHFDSEKEPGFVSNVNILPVWKILSKGGEYGLKKFIYFSTVQVYGKFPDTLITEEYAPNPINGYGLTHLLSEKICSYYNRTTPVDVITVRLSNSYGSPIFHENKCWWLAINELCKNAYVNGKIGLTSDGSPKRDFIHGEDVSRAVQLLINTDTKLEDNIYHISFGSTLTLMEIAAKIQKEYTFRYQKELLITTPTGNYTEAPVSKKERYNLSNKKIQEIGFSPLYTIEQGINELFDYMEINMISKVL